jgi:hypothetical protein
MTIMTVQISHLDFLMSRSFTQKKKSPFQLLAALQKEINSHIESLRGNGCPKQKIVDLATLIDIMLEKDLDRLDRMLLYRLSSQNGRFDPRLFQWLESLAMAYWFHQLTEDDLSRLLSQLAYPSTENSKSGAETLNSHSKEVELTPASGKSDGGCRPDPIEAASTKVDQSPSRRHHANSFGLTWNLSEKFKRR